MVTSGVFCINTQFNSLGQAKNKKIKKTAKKNKLYIFNKLGKYHLPNYTKIAKSVRTITTTSSGKSEIQASLHQAVLPDILQQAKWIFDFWPTAQPPIIAYI